MTTDVTATTQRLYEAFPDLQIAVRDGRDWESKQADWRPEVPETYPLNCADEEADEPDYRLITIVRGAGVRTGEIYEVRWLVDECGRSVQKEYCPLDSPVYAFWCSQYDAQAIKSAWATYVEHVAETGNDPLEYLAVPPATDNKDEEWQVLVEDATEVLGIEGVVVRAVRRQKHARWRGLADVPAYVRISLVGAAHDSDRLLGIDSFEELQSLANTPGYVRGCMLPGTLKRLGRDEWTFTALVSTEPEALRAIAAAEEWLRRNAAE